MSSDGIVIRQAAGEVSRQKRDSTGVRIMNLAPGAELSAGTVNEDGSVTLTVDQQRGRKPEFISQGLEQGHRIVMGLTFHIYRPIYTLIRICSFSHISVTQ